MSNELAIPTKPVPTQRIGMGIVPQTVEEASTLANALYKTGVFPTTKDAAQAFAKVMIGAEYGCSAVFSMTNIYTFQGNIGMQYPMMVAIVKRAGYRFTVLEQNDKVCSIQFMNPDGSECGPPSTFTEADARKAGTQNMNKFPQAMLFARAFSMGCRMYCADAFAGAVYSKEEIEDMEFSEVQETPVLTQGTSKQLAAKISRKTGDEFDPWVTDPEPEEDAPSVTLTEDELRDFNAVCESLGKDPKAVSRDAQSAGISTPEALFEFAQQDGLGL